MILSPANGPPIIYLDTNAILDIISGIVGLSVSYVSYKYNRLIQERILDYISLGFILLGIGLVIQGFIMLLLGFNFARIREDIRLTYISSVMYLILQLAAYLIITVGYSREAYWSKSALGFLLTYFVIKKREYLLLGAYIFDASQLIIILLLGFIVFLGFLVHVRDRSSFSLLVLLSFFLMLVSHITFLFSSLIFSDFYYLIANIIQFLGFLLLLVFLVRSGHIGRTKEK
ncbi:MAG: hypothetical protein ACP5I6_01460 [Caldisphaera sp.]|jgi:MFS family permease